MRILGVDEVGRGCLAGPLVVGAVLLDCSIDGIKDSKLLSTTKRKVLSKEIYTKAIYVGLGWVSAEEIDAIGLSASLTLASKRALSNMDDRPDKIILDGNFNYLPDIYNSETLIRGDSIIPAISAASIVAKVARDNFMMNLHDQFPQFGFKTNVGYGTKSHKQALVENGYTIYHRKSFEPIRTFLHDNILASY